MVERCFNQQQFITSSRVSLAHYCVSICTNIYAKSVCSHLRNHLFFPWNYCHNWDILSYICPRTSVISIYIHCNVAKGWCFSHSSVVRVAGCGAVAVLAISICWLRGSSSINYQHIRNWDIWWSSLCQDSQINPCFIPRTWHLNSIDFRQSPISDFQVHYFDINI